MLQLIGCFEIWANITQDRFALNIVKFGLTIEFAEVPVCQLVPPFNFSRLETEVIDAEISKHPSKGVIVTTTTEINGKTKQKGGTISTSCNKHVKDF